MAAAETIRVMEQQGIDVNHFARVVERLALLRNREPERELLASQKATLLHERERILESLRRDDEARRLALVAAVRTANEGLNGAAFVKPVPAAKRDHIAAIFRVHLRGQRGQVMAALEAPEFSVSEFIETARNQGSNGLEERYGIRGAQAAAVVGAGEHLLRDLEGLSVGLAAEVSLDIGSASHREYRELGRLSKGQRATALLLLLLGSSDRPLVIDQPEDDLDNRFVFEGVVRRLRDLKGKRQIIASTHNANVPVLGDAELIVTLQGDGHKSEALPEGTGSIDVASVREIARGLLEGGKAAFEARQHIYGY